VFWPKRADSLCAVINADMQSSDMRENIISRGGAATFFRPFRGTGVWRGATNDDWKFATDEEKKPSMGIATVKNKKMASDGNIIAADARGEGILSFQLLISC
jgi:hypothetical protein